MLSPYQRRNMNTPKSVPYIFFICKDLPTQRLSSQVGSQARQSSTAYPVNPAIKGTGTENPGHPAWLRSGASGAAPITAKMPESCTKRTGGSTDARPFEGQIL